VAVLKSIVGAKKESRTFFVGAFKVGWGCSTGLMAVSEAEFNRKGNWIAALPLRESRLHAKPLIPGN
jgi:hypothetical protein